MGGALDRAQAPFEFRVLPTEGLQFAQRALLGLLLQLPTLQPLLALRTVVALVIVVTFEASVLAVVLIVVIVVRGVDLVVGIVVLGFRLRRFARCGQAVDLDDVDVVLVFASEYVAHDVISPLAFDLQERF